MTEVSMRIKLLDSSVGGDSKIGDQRQSLFWRQPNSRLEVHLLHCMSG